MWRKSTYSGTEENCVEVAPGPVSHVRDTKDREGGTIVFSAAAWGAFLRKAKR